MKTYTADFETSTFETSEKETWVWAWGHRELFKKDSFDWGTDIEDFMSFCESGTDSKLLYFHNLKFDGHFILDYLLRSGVKWVTGYQMNKDGSFKLVGGQKVKEKARPNTFKTLITIEGLFYSIEWIHSVSKKKGVKKTIFRDSLKKLPFTVERIAKSFKLPMLKGEIDYNKVRPKGYTPTMKEIDYLQRDVEIMAQALEIQLNEGQTGMTIGSDALHRFTDDIGGDDRFKKLFPVLDYKDNEEIRKSYKGGFTYLNPRYRNLIVRGGKVYDINSLYPAMMLKKLPYGKPLKFKGQYQYTSSYPLYIQRIYCELELKDNHIPTIQIKNNYRFKSTEYITSTKGQPVELMLTNVDLDLMYKHYHVTEYEFRGGYMFKQIEGIFSDYIQRLMKIKENSDGAIRELAKLLLNNLYGKFATSTDAKGKTPQLNEEEDRVELVEGMDDKKESIYTAVGSFITSYARETTITACQNNYDRFIYADTDSLHIEGYEPPKGIEIHPTALGKWKFEGDWVKGKFIRSKTYIEELCLKWNEKKEKYVECAVNESEKTKLKVTCAGMPDRLKKTVTFENFNEGSEFHGKLRPYVIKGGVVLVETDFTIKC